MKILLLNPLYAKSSALFIRVDAIAASLQKLNWRVTTYTVSGASLFFMFLFIIKVAWQILCGHKVDCIYAFKSLPSSVLPALLGKWLGKTKKIILDVDDLEYALWHTHPRLSRFLQWFEKKTLPRFDLITTHNQNLHLYINVVHEIPEDKILFLKQALDMRLYAPPPTQDRASPENLLIVYCAFLGVASSLESFLPLWKEINRKYPAWKLQVIGEGSKRREYQEYATQNNLGIDFLGYKDHQETLNYLRGADLALNYLDGSPSDRFRSSLKLREYLALGKRIISSAFFDAEIFRDYISIFTPDITSLEKACQEALQLPVNNLAGRKFITENFDMDEVVKDLVGKLGEGQK